MFSDISLWIGSMIASIKTLIAPAQAHNKGFSNTNSLKSLMLVLFRYSSEDSDKVTSELARNLGKLFGESFIHFSISLRQPI